MKNASAHYESSILFPCAVMADKLLKLFLDEYLLLHRFGSKCKHFNLFVKGRFKCFCSDIFSGKLRGHASFSVVNMKRQFSNKAKIMNFTQCFYHSDWLQTQQGCGVNHCISKDKTWLCDNMATGLLVSKKRRNMDHILSSYVKIILSIQQFYHKW